MSRSTCATRQLNNEIVATRASTKLAPHVAVMHRWQSKPTFASTHPKYLGRVTRPVLPLMPESSIN